jgi:hypothetical protein
MFVGEITKLFGSGRAGDALAAERLFGDSRPTDAHTWLAEAQQRLATGNTAR